MAGGLNDFGLVHTDERAQDGQILCGIGALQSLDGLACHLCQTFAGNQRFAPLLFSDYVCNAHHAAAHQHREQHIRGVIPDVFLRFCVGHHEQVGAAGIHSDKLRQSLYF